MVKLGKYQISTYNITCVILLICSIPSPNMFTSSWGFGLIFGIFIPFFIRFIRLKVNLSNPHFWNVLALGLLILFIITDIFVVNSWWLVRQGFVTGALLALIMILVMDHVHSDEEDEEFE
ncbi:hypothetical protein WDW89_10225 [Deltaproteobacteria bacterium TL4]